MYNLRKVVLVLMVVCSSPGSVSTGSSSPKRHQVSQRLVSFSFSLVQMFTVGTSTNVLLMFSR